MACVSGSRLVTDGLVFHYDVANRQKSWINPPGKNHFGYSLNNNFNTTQTDYKATLDVNSSSAGWGHWGTTGVSASFAANTDRDFIYYPGASYSHYVDVSSSSPVPYIMYQVVPFEGQEYGTLNSGWGGGNPNNNLRSMKVIVKRSDGGPITKYVCYPAWNGHASYYPYNNGVSVSPEGSSGANPTPWTSIKHLKNGWYECRAEGILQDGTNDLIGVYVMPGYRVYFGFCQLEETAKCSEKLFVGTRSNTEAIIDVAGNNTITANSLTYNSDGTFEFDGVDDYLSLGTQSIETLLGVSNPTEANVSFIFKPYSKRNHGVFNLGSALRVGMNSNGTLGGLLFYLDGSWRNAGGASYLLDSNNIYHVSLSYNNRLVEVYINGEFISSSSFDIDWFTTSTYETNIGAYLGNPAMHGELYNMMIHNRALSHAEVKQNYEAYRSRYGL